MRANDGDLLYTFLDQQSRQLVDGAAGRDLVIIDQGLFMSANVIADQPADSHLRVRNTFLVPGSDGQVQTSGKARSRFSGSQVGSDDDVISQVASLQIFLEDR